MRTLAWLKNHCMDLDRMGVGYMHPHISAVEVLAIIAQVESENNTRSLPLPECEPREGHDSAIDKDRNG